MQFFVSELSAEFSKYLKAGISKATDVILLNNQKSGSPTIGSSLATLSLNDDDVKRPSVLLLEIQAYFSGAEWIQNYLNIDLTTKLRSIYLKEIDPKE